MIGNQILKRQWIPSLINVVFQTLELPLFLISFCRDLRAFLLLAKAASTASRILLSSQSVTNLGQWAGTTEQCTQPSREKIEVYFWKNHWRQTPYAAHGGCWNQGTLRRNPVSYIISEWVKNGKKIGKHIVSFQCCHGYKRGCLAPLWRFSVPRERSGEAWNVWWCLWTLIANGMSQGCMKSLCLYTQWYALHTLAY